VVDALVIVTLVATGALAVYGIVEVLRKQPPGRWLTRALFATVALLAVQAAIGAYRVLVDGVQLPEQSTFLIYLAVSVLVLPVALQWANAEPNRWGGGIVAVGAIGVFVAVFRLWQLWVPGV
jgi:heme A synthase